MLVLRGNSVVRMVQGTISRWGWVLIGGVFVGWSTRGLGGVVVWVFVAQEKKEVGEENLRGKLLLENRAPPRSSCDSSRGRTIENCRILDPSSVTRRSEDLKREEKRQLRPTTGGEYIFR